MLSVQHLAAFISNYAGGPFTVPFMKNAALIRACLVNLLAIAFLFTELAPGANAYLELVPFPSPEYHAELTGLLAIDLLGSTGLAKGVDYLYALLQR